MCMCVEMIKTATLSSENPEPAVGMFQSIHVGK